MTTIKLDPSMIQASGTPNSSNYLRGDGSWGALIMPPVWATAAGNIAIANEQAVFTTTVLAVDVNNLTLSYTVTSGALPTGLVLNSATGVISGTTPTVTANITSTFTISASNGTNSTQRVFSITVNNSTNEPPVWSTAAGSLGIVNTNSSFNYSLSATDPNTDVLSYSITSGSLPAGLSMSSLGVITGTTSTISSTTTSNFTVRASDGNGGTVDRSFSITVNVPAYTVSNSLRLFYPSQTAWLQHTPSTNGSNTNFAVSFWAKKANNGTYQALFSTDGDPTDYDDTIAFGAANKIQINYYFGMGSAINLSTIRSDFNDLNKWYHICLIVNTNEPTQTDRVKFYVDGAQITSFETSGYAYVYPSLGQACGNMNQTRIRYWGRQQYWGAYFGGYLAECYIVDNQTVSINDFGIDIGGVWKPKKYTGPLGTNGCYLEFKNSGNLGLDSAGTPNWNMNNISAANSSTDTPNP